MLSSKNAQFLGYVDLRTPTILSSEIKCPKSGIFTNNYWWSESGRVISQVSIAVFFGRCKKIVQRWLSPPWIKLARTPMASMKFKSMRNKPYLSAIFAKYKLYVLAGIDEHVPVFAGRWFIAVYVNHINLGNMQQTQHTDEEHEVHLAASYPDHVTDVGRQPVKRWYRFDDVPPTVEFIPQYPANVAV